MPNPTFTAQIGNGPPDHASRGGFARECLFAWKMMGLNIALSMSHLRFCRSNRGAIDATRTVRKEESGEW